MRDCADFSIDLAELSRRLRREGHPLGGMLELTQRCNLECVHCYCRQNAGDPSIRSRELTGTEICEIVDQIAEEGCLHLLLTGGEPLLHKDFLDIYDYIHERGFLVQLFTNGTLITSSIADHLQHHPPLSVEISLYGATKSVYESITGIPGSYEKCVRGIHFLRERGIRVTLKTPLMTLNVAELDLLKEKAAEVGSDFYYDVFLHPRLYGMEDRFGPYDYRLPLRQRLALELDEVETIPKWEARVAQLAQSPPSATLYQCGAGRFGFFVDAYGHLMMCVSARYPSYDLRKGTFREGWYDFLVGLRALPVVSDSPCNDCEDQPFCQQCPARSQLEFGPHDLNTPVDDICQMGHLRARALRENRRDTK
jgi:radical SAM protein with 4Fe4S-binding SPASM domain